jgi:tetratricopeptide (TPR) repeat protein
MAPPKPFPQNGADAKRGRDPDGSPNQVVVISAALVAFAGLAFGLYFWRDEAKGTGDPSLGTALYFVIIFLCSLIGSLMVAGVLRAVAHYSGKFKGGRLTLGAAGTVFFIILTIGIENRPTETVPGVIVGSVVDAEGAPIPDATVAAATEERPTARSDQLGGFCLRFKELGAGDRSEIVASKTGLKELFPEELRAVPILLGRANAELHVVMCRSDEWDDQRNRVLLKKLFDGIASGKKPSAAQVAILKQIIPEFVGGIASDGNGNPSSNSQSLVAAILKGNTSEALDTVSAQSLTARELKLNLDSQTIAKDWIRNGDLLAIQLDFSGAADSYIHAAELARDDLETQEKCAKYLHELGKFQAAEGYYKRALALVQRNRDKDYASIIGEYGLVEKEWHNYADAEEKLEAARDAFRRVVEATGSDADNANLGTAEENLGWLYHNEGKNAQAADAFSVELGTFRRLVLKDDEAFAPGLVTALQNLALLYKDTGRKAESVAMSDEQLQRSSQLVSRSPATGLMPHVEALKTRVLIEKDFGTITNAARFNEQVRSFLDRFGDDKKVEIQKAKAEASVQMGILDKDQLRFDAAIADFDDALKRYSKLVDNEPELFGADAVKTTNMLGWVYNDAGSRLAQAEGAFLKAKADAKRLAEIDNRQFGALSASCSSILGKFYIDSGRRDESRRAYNEALSIYEALDLQDPGAYRAKMEAIRAVLSAAR